MKTNLPEYIEKSVPVPHSSRVSWYSSTFPTYFGIFLWVGYYLKLSGPTIGIASPAVGLMGLLAAGLLCFALYYYVPAMLGMLTGRPLYVVGSSTFGTTGGYLIPGLLMGMLQIGWVAVIAAVAANFIMSGLNKSSHVLFCAIVAVWLTCLGWVAVKGIHYVGRVAKVLNWIPFIMIVTVLWSYRGGLANYQPAHTDSLAGFLNAITITIGFFASAGAAGADFGMNNRNGKDITLGGLTGVAGGAFIAGGLSILCVSGYIGLNPGATNYDFSAAIAGVGALAPIMFFLFAAASMVPTCFSSFIAANSFSTMLPMIPRGVSTFIAVAISGILAVTGVADNLVGFFSIVAASFGPICGAMMADYFLAGKQWSGPREGINWAGYIAWMMGFLVGIPDDIPGLPSALVKFDNPSALYAFAVGFLVYVLLSKLGVRPPVVSGIAEAPQELNPTLVR
jgi:cytosine permease